MRVIAGEFGGRRLKAPASGQATRPTAARVREALFSALGDISNLSILDIFAGCGTLAIEALSRGAQSAVLVERDRRAAAAIAANLAALGLNDGRAELRRSDAGRALQEAARRRESYDLIFIDPPYRLADELKGMLTVALPTLVSPSALIVTESDRRLPLTFEHFETAFDRRYGDTVIRIYRA